jgi:hypothetical protein
MLRVGGQIGHGPSQSIGDAGLMANCVEMALAMARLAASKPRLLGFQSAMA